MTVCVNGHKSNAVCFSLFYRPPYRRRRNRETEIRRAGIVRARLIPPICTGPSRL